jgi:hypothetical protein
MTTQHDDRTPRERLEPFLFFFGTLAALAVLIGLVCREALG